MDGLRGIAILMVVFSHVGETCSPTFLKWVWPLALFADWDCGVTIFFVLSGYLITSILLREYDTIGRIDMKAFYMRRILRIFPAFYLFLLFLIGLDLAGAIHLPASDFLFAGSHLINYSTAIHLAFHWPVETSSDYWFIGHFWTLSMEEQFYWMWPLTLTVLLRKRWWGVLAVVILALPLIRLTSYYLCPGLRGQLGMMLHTGSDGIFTGCLLAILLARRPPLGTKLLLPAWGVALVPVYICLVNPLIGSVMPRGFGLLAGKTLLLVAIVLFLANVLLQEGPNWYHRFLENRVLVFLGRISYSLYLWQQVFLTTYDKTWLGKFPINLAMAILVGWLSYRFVEQPFIRLKDRFSPAHTKRAKPEAGIAVAVPAGMR